LTIKPKRVLQSNRHVIVEKRIVEDGYLVVDSFIFSHRGSYEGEQFVIDVQGDSERRKRLLLENIFHAHYSQRCLSNHLMHVPSSQPDPLPSIHMDSPNSHPCNPLFTVLVEGTYSG
jgi:hypothetical protein